MNHGDPFIDLMHLITSGAYFVVGFVLYWCGVSPKFRFTLLRNKNDRATAFKLVAVFVFACFMDHAADALGASIIMLQITAIAEAIVSAGTAFFLVGKAAVQWKSK
jgi:hypothetical protein